MNLLDLFVSVSVKDTATKQLKSLESQGQRTDKALSGIGDGSDRSLGTLESQASSTGQRLEDMSGKAKGAGLALTAFAGGALALGGKALVDYSSNLENAGIAFETMLGSAEKADAFLKDLQQFAKSTPFEFPELVDASKRMLAFGFESKEIIPILTSVGDASAALGGGADTIDGITTAMGQMSASGRVALEEINQLTERGVPALDILADGFGVTTGEMRDMISDGAVPAEKAIKVLTDGMNERFGGQMAEQSKTLTGALSNLQDTVMQTANEAFKPFYEVLSQAALGLSNFLSNNPEIARLATVLTFAAVGVAAVVGPMLLLVGLFAPLIASFAAGTITIAGITGAIGGFLAAALPVVAVIGALAAAGYLIYKNWDSISAAVQPVVGVFKNFASIIGGVFTGNIEQAEAALMKLPGWLQPIGNFLGTAAGRLRSFVDTVRNGFTVVKGILSGDTGTKAFMQAWANLPGPVRTAITFIVSAFRQIKAVAAPILSSVGSAIKSGLGAAFEFVVTQAGRFVNFVRSGFSQLQGSASGPLSVVANILKTVLGAALKFAVQNVAILVNWFRSNFPLIRQTVQTVLGFVGTIFRTTFSVISAVVRTAFNVIKTVVGAGLRAAAAIIKTVWAGVTAFWKQNNQQILSIVRSVWNIIKTVIQTALRVVLGIIKAVMQVITGDWRGAWNTIKNTLSVVWNAIKTVVKNALNIVRNVIQIAWNTIKSITQAAFGAVRDFISSRLQAAKELATKAVNSLKDAAISAWETLRDRAGEIFERVKSAMVSPMEAARDTLKSIWNGLLDGIAKVLDVIPGMGDAAQKVKSAKFGEGGSTRGQRGGGGLPAANARSGSRSGSRGRVSPSRVGVAPHPRMAYRSGGKLAPHYVTDDTWVNYGEALKSGEREYFLTEARSHAKRNKALWTEYGQRTGFLGEVGHGPHRHSHFDAGGWTDNINNYPTSRGGYPWLGHVAQIANLVAKRIGSSPSTYPGHLPTQEQAIDFMQANRVDEPGDTIADFLWGNAPALGLDYEIWKQRIRGAGSGSWSQMEDRGSDTQNHFDHVHGSFATSPGSGKVSSNAKYFGSGGGGGGGLINAAIQAAWDRFVQPLVKKVKDAVDGNHILRKALVGAVDMVVDPIREWALAQAGGSSGGPGNDFKGGGDPARNRKLGEEMLAASTVPGAWSSLDSLWQKESGWNHLAQNPSSGAYGIPQSLPGDKMASSGADWKTNPATQIDWGLGYISERYGSTDAAWAHSQQYNWYEKGGLAVGPQLMSLAERGKELVLPLENAQVMRSAQTALGTAELRAEIADLRSAIVGKLDDVNLGAGSREDIKTGSYNRARDFATSSENQKIVVSHTNRHEKVGGFVGRR